MQLRHVIIAYLRLRHKAQSAREPPQYPRPHMSRELRAQQQRTTGLQRSKAPDGKYGLASPSHQQYFLQERARWLRERQRRVNSLLSSKQSSPVLSKHLLASMSSQGLCPTSVFDITTAEKATRLKRRQEKEQAVPVS